MPGTAVRLSTSSRAWRRSFGSRGRPGRGDRLTSRTPRKSKPIGVCRRLTSVRMKSPAPASRTSESAISATRRPRSHRDVDRTTVRMFALAPAAPCRLASQAGASPAARLTAARVATESGQDPPVGRQRDRQCGSPSARSNVSRCGVAAVTNGSPASVPNNVSNAPSASIWRTRSPRDAPSATRTRNSASRAAAPASSVPARLTPAITSIHSVRPTSSVSDPAYRVRRNENPLRAESTSRRLVR